MTFYLNLSWIEYGLLSLFVLTYLLYFFLLKRKARQLNTSLRYQLLKPTLRFTYVGLLCIVLLGPMVGLEKKKVKVVGKDIMLAVDVSTSMNAVDIQPTRLEKIKFELKHLIEAFKESRIGLIVFSSEAALQCPLTYDHAIIKDIFLQSLSTDLMAGGGTDFEQALSLVLEKYQNDQLEAENRGKVLILLSDGEHFGNAYAKVTRELADLNIKVYTVGVGTVAGSAIPTRRGVKRDREGEEIITQLVDEDLREIAAQTGGKYFLLNNTTNEVPQLIAQIQNMRGQVQDTRVLDTNANKYRYFLWIVLFLVVLDILIMARVIKL